MAHLVGVGVTVLVGVNDGVGVTVVVGVTDTALVVGVIVGVTVIVGVIVGVADIPAVMVKTPPIVWFPLKLANNHPLAGIDVFGCVG